MKWTRPLGSAQIGPSISSGETHLPNVTVISRPLVRAYECVQQVQRLSFKGIQCAHMRPNVRRAKVQRMLILVNEIYMRFDYTCACVTFEDPLTRGVSNIRPEGLNGPAKTPIQPTGWFWKIWTEFSLYKTFQLDKDLHHDPSYYTIVITKRYH